jgi:hypothetical protein
MSNIKFVEREIVDLRQAKYRIENNGGCVVAEMIDFGNDVILIYSTAPKHYDDEDVATYGLVHILMDGYVSTFQDQLTLIDASREAFHRLLTEITGEGFDIQITR